MACVVCGSADAIDRKPLNGYPVGLAICLECYEAVKRREVGIVKRAEGSLHVTDGRHVEDAPKTTQAQQPGLFA